MAGDTLNDARLAAFLLMEASGLTALQMWQALAPFLSRRDRRRRRPRWADVHERVTDLILCARVEAEAGARLPGVLVLWEGGAANAVRGS